MRKFEEKEFPFKVRISEDGQSQDLRLPKGAMAIKYTKRGSEVITVEVTSSSGKKRKASMHQDLLEKV